MASPPKRRWIKRVLGFGLLAGAAYAVWKAIEQNRTDDDLRWEAQPFPFPPQPRADSPPQPRADSPPQGEAP